MHACPSEKVQMGLKRAWACRKPLQFEDMWKLPHQDRVANLSRQFEQVWDQEVKKPKPSLVRLPPRLVMPDVCLHI